MKRMNWGWGILGFYLAFVGFILFLVYKTTTVKVDLVTPDYYAQELKFQDKLEKEKRAFQLEEKLTWKVRSGNIQLIFPEEFNGGEKVVKVLFYNPANKDSDFEQNITLTKNSYDINTQQRKSGMYQMQIDWAVNGVTYYSEGYVNIN